MKEHALAVFRRPPARLNCAQAVGHGYQEVSGNRSLSMADLKPFGGGRAPGGLCGALHAACLIVPDKANALQAQFARRMGSTLCEELRDASQYSCQNCVAQAADLLELAAGGK